MARLGAFLAVAVVACAAAAAAAQAKVPPQPSCLYVEASKACIPALTNMLAPTAAQQPTTVFRKAYLMSLDKAEACSKLTTEAACNAATTDRCFWRSMDKAKGACLAADFAEITAFERSGLTVDLPTIPAALTCPGSRAAEFFSCHAHPAADMCDKLPGCVSAPAGMTAPGAKAVCLSKYAAGLNKTAAAAFAAQLRSLDPVVTGTCEAACFLRQARMCSNFTSQVACEKTSFCAYNAQAKACARAVVAKMGVSAYDDRVGALMSACPKLATKEACLAAPKVELLQAGEWRAWRVSPATAQCALV